MTMTRTDCLFVDQEPRKKIFTMKLTPREAPWLEQTAQARGISRGKLVRLLMSQAITMQQTIAGPGLAASE